MSPVSLTGRGWGYLVAALILAASWFFVGLRDIWYLAAFPAALLLVGVVTVVAVRVFARPTVDVSAGDVTVSVGESLAVRAGVRHRFPLPLPLVARWNEEVGRRFPESFRARAGQRSEMAVEWYAAKRGPTTISLEEVTFRDPLGLATCRWNPVDITADVLVLPRLFESWEPDITSVAVTSATEDREIASLTGSMEAAPDGALRRYQAGDAMRQVHWKQSARQDELLVHLQERQQPAEAVVVLVTDAGSYRDDRDFERAVSAAATLAVEWVRDGLQVRVLAGHDNSSDATTFEDDLLHLFALIHREDARTDGIPPVPNLRHASEVAVVAAEATDHVLTVMEELGGGGTFVSVAPATDQPLPAGWASEPVPYEQQDGGNRVSP